MKYLKVLLIMLLFPVLVLAEECDVDKISISSIAIQNKTENVTEVSEATASGKNINLDLSMTSVGDKIEYKFVVQNDSNEDYELDKNSFNMSSNYINYSFTSDDNSNIVKANSSKTVYLKVEYKNPVPKGSLENGIYNDDKKLSFNLSSETAPILEAEKAIQNPNTAASTVLILVMIVLIISGVMYIILINKDYLKLFVLIICASVIIPLTVHALCKCDITINSNVEINTVSKFYVANHNNTTNEYSFITGMTWREFLESDYNVAGWTTTTYTGITHFSSQSSGGERDEFNYIPNSGVGIRVGGDSWWCDRNFSLENVYAITSFNGIELIDNVIQKEYTYGVTSGSGC